jgi:hypothetical protein
MKGIMKVSILFIKTVIWNWKEECKEKELVYIVTENWGVPDIDRFFLRWGYTYYLIWSWEKRLVVSCWSQVTVIHGND